MSRKASIFQVPILSSFFEEIRTYIIVTFQVPVMRPPLGWMRTEEILLKIEKDTSFTKSGELNILVDKLYTEPMICYVCSTIACHAY